MREGLGVDPALRLLLDPVVPDRLRRRERLVDVPGWSTSWAYTDAAHTPA